MKISLEPPKRSVEIRTLSRSLVSDNIDSLVGIAADIAGEYWTEEHFLAERPEKWVLSFALWSGGRPVAYAILSHRDADYVHLHHFMVAASFRGGGLGALMITEMERRVQQAGFHRLTLKVAVKNRNAQRFYRRHGYIEAGRANHYLVLTKNFGICGKGRRSP